MVPSAASEVKSYHVTLTFPRRKLMYEMQAQKYLKRFLLKPSPPVLLYKWVPIFLFDMCRYSACDNCKNSVCPEAISARGTMCAPFAQTPWCSLGIMFLQQCFCWSILVLPKAFLYDSVVLIKVYRSIKPSLENLIFFLSK